MAGPSTKLLFIPGTLFWVLVIAGVLTDNYFMMGGGVALLLVTVIGTFVARGRASAAERAERQRIWAQGTAGRARVVELGSKGMINRHPIVELELDVALPDQAPYRARVRSLISSLAVPRIQPGCELDVRVDPADRGRVVVDPALSP